MGGIFGEAGPAPVIGQSQPTRAAAQAASGSPVVKMKLRPALRSSARRAGGPTTKAPKAP